MTKKKALLFLVLLLSIFIIAYYAFKYPLQNKKETLPPSGQLKPEADSALITAFEGITDSVISPVNDSDSIEHQLSSSAKSKAAHAKKPQTWESALNSINLKLLHCKDWFDTVQVLSTWLYQNIRVGNVYKYHITRIIPKHYVVLHLDLKYLYELHCSDTVVGNCGYHTYFAQLLYRQYGIKSYCFSMRPNQNLKKSAEGHMINILENPNNKRWYPVDHFYGIRYRYDNEWLDMEEYFQLSGEQLCSVTVETFGNFKIHIQDVPFLPFDKADKSNSETISVERGKDGKYFRIAAPMTLKHDFSQQYIRVLFDSIAATYGQPPHADWVDLARRMPLYGARIFPLSDVMEQASADSLLKSWKLHPQEFQYCPPQQDGFSSFQK